VDIFDPTSAGFLDIPVTKYPVLILPTAGDSAAKNKLLFDITILQDKIFYWHRDCSYKIISQANHYLSKTRGVVMKKHLFSTIIVVGAVVVLMGLGVNAFAGMGQMQGMSASNTNLTDDQVKQMQSERTAFQTATQGIHQQLNEKRQALNAELAKQAPDAAAAAALQKNISDLQAQFDQKRLTHILNMKKIDPNFTEGPGMGYGMGPGMGHRMAPGMTPGMGQSPPGGGPNPSN
jgi:Spy/CpxP family protein refolding chaperone